VFNQKPVDIRQQILRFIELYETYEQRQTAVEVADHVFWMLRDFRTTEDTKKVHLITTIGRIKRYVSRLGEQSE
jgi:hypothetical protein